MPAGQNSASPRMPDRSVYRAPAALPNSASGESRVSTIDSIIGTMSCQIPVPGSLTLILSVGPTLASARPQSFKPSNTLYRPTPNGSRIVRPRSPDRRDHAPHAMGVKILLIRGRRMLRRTRPRSDGPTVDGRWIRSIRQKSQGNMPLLLCSRVGNLRNAGGLSKSCCCHSTHQVRHPRFLRQSLGYLEQSAGAGSGGMSRPL
jgi:hypothetical protein